MRDLLKIAKESGASQDWFELWQMLEVADQLKPKKILEIGVHTGLGLKAFRDAFPGADLFGLELDTQYLQFKDFLLIEGDSTEPDIIRLVESYGPFDFIFIDGDHTYEGVKADWENYHGMVRAGGAVGFHDTSRMGEGWMSKVEVRRLLDELWASNSYRSAEFFNGRENPGVAIIWPES
jgi:predicted O-methyltransferase YrrM